MKSILWKLTLRLKRKPYWIQVLVLYLLSFLIACFVLPFIYMTNELIGENDSKTKITSWILILIIGPILETFLNQYLPFKLMQNWNRTKNKYGLFIFFSAIVFGLTHFYSIQYILFAFSVGLVLGYTYCFYSKNPNKAFWTTALIHGLRNSFSFIIIWFIK